jgi:hypothetical protein
MTDPCVKTPKTTSVEAAEGGCHEIHGCEMHGEFCCQIKRGQEPDVPRATYLTKGSLFAHMSGDFAQSAETLGHEMRGTRAAA